MFNHLEYDQKSHFLDNYIMDSKVQCEQQLSTLAVISFCTFPHGWPELQKVPCHGGSQEKLGEYGGLLGQTYRDGLELLLTSKSWIINGWKEEHQAWQKFATWTSCTSTTYVASFHPPSWIAKHVKFVFWYTIQVGGSYVAATHLQFGTCIWVMYGQRLVVKNGHHKYTWYDEIGR